MKILPLTLALLFELQGQAAWAAPPFTGAPRVAPVPVAPLPIEQQVAVLQQQVQALQAQLASLQAVVRITPPVNGNQRPTLTIEAGELNVRVDDSVGVAAGGMLSMRASALTLSGSGSAVLQAGGTLNLRGSLTILNNGGKPLAIVGSLVQPLPAAAGSGAPANTWQVVTGSQTILGN